MKKLEFDVWYAITLVLPKKLIYMCLIRATAEITTTQLRTVEVGEISADSIINIYKDEHKQINVSIHEKVKIMDIIGEYVKKYNMCFSLKETLKNSYKIYS